MTKVVINLKINSKVLIKLIIMYLNVISMDVEKYSSTRICLLIIKMTFNEKSKQN
jgi:hypothetical protein